MNDELMYFVIFYPGDLNKMSQFAKFRNIPAVKDSLNWVRVPDDEIAVCYHRLRGKSARFVI